MTAIRSFILSLSFLLASSPNLPAWVHGYAVPGSFTWQQIPIGPGGQVTGISIAPDGTGVSTTDVFGAYVRQAGSTQWNQLFTPALRGDFATQITGAPCGAWEIAVAPSQTGRLVLNTSGKTFISNGGSAWSYLSAIPTLSGGACAAGGNTDPNGPFKYTRQKIAIDPINADVIYVGTNNNGLQRSFNAGSTAAKVTDITDSSAGPGNAGIVFDPASGTTTCPSGGGNCTKVLFVGVYGNGVWSTSDGGTTWTQIADGTGDLSPVNIWNARIAPDGAYWLVDHVNVWKFTCTTPSVDCSSGTWLKITGANVSMGGTTFINAVVPNIDHTGVVVFFQTSSAQSMTVTNNGTLLTDSFTCKNYSLSGSSCFGLGSVTLSATDVPWLAVGTISGGASLGDAAYDPSTGKFCSGNGVGIFCATIPITTTTCGGSQCYSAYTLTSQNLYIEELVMRDSVAPVGGVPVIVGDDRSTFAINSMFTYPSAYGPINGGFNLANAVDFASNDPSIVCIRAVSGLGSPHDQSGCSNNYGQAESWTLFTSPADTNGGAIAVATSQKIVMLGGQNGVLYCSVNGTSFVACTDVPTATGAADFQNPRGICADRVTIGTFYYYLNAGSPGFYSTTDPANAWSLVRAGSLGANAGTNFRLRCIKNNSNINDLWFAGSLGQFNPGSFFLQKSTDGGANWTAISTANGFCGDVTSLIDFGYGATASGGSYPTLWVYGYVNGTSGIWRSTDGFLTCTRYDYPTTLDYITSLNGDMSNANYVYATMGGSGAWRGRLN